MRPPTVFLTGAAALLTVSVAAQQPQPDPQTADQLQQQASFSSAELARIARGLEIAPVPLDLSGRNPALVGLGSYLVNAAGGCNDCHTNPSFAEGGDPFEGQPKRINEAGYLAGGRAFGPFTSRNLTPDPSNGAPGGLTYVQFRRTMRTGVDLRNLHPNISPLLQVMPWVVYQDLTDRDLRAIYEFLSAIPHAEPNPAPPPPPNLPLSPEAQPNLPPSPGLRPSVPPLPGIGSRFQR
jgi:hypothetical protein